MRNSVAYQVDEAERRERAIAAEAARAEKQGREAAEPLQDVHLDMLREACRPDTPLGLSRIHFQAVDVATAERGSYDTAFITDALCWEDGAVAKERLRHAWALVRPGGCLLLVDYGRPRGKMLARAVDWVEQQRMTSLRLTLDYVAHMKEAFGDEAVWPPELDRRGAFGFGYTVVLRKKESEEAAATESAAAEPKLTSKQA